MNETDLERITSAETWIDKALEALGEDAAKGEVAKWIKKRYSLDLSKYMLTYADLSESDKRRYMEIVNTVDRNRGNPSRVTPRKILLTISTGGLNIPYYFLKDVIISERRISRDRKFLDLMCELCAKYGKPALSVSDFPNFPRIPSLYVVNPDGNFSIFGSEKTFFLFGADLRRKLAHSLVIEL